MRYHSSREDVTGMLGRREDFREACCVSFLLLHNKLPQTQWLKKTPICQLVVPQISNLHGIMTGFSIWYHKAEIKMSAGLSSHVEALGWICFQHYSCWQNSILVVVGLRSPLFPGLAVDLYSPPSSNPQQNFLHIRSSSHIESLSDFLFCYQHRKLCF